MDMFYEIVKEQKATTCFCSQLLQKRWTDLGVHKFDAASKKPIFSIDTPPPTVSGKLHIGHIFSYTQAEMIARYKRMRGFNVFYPFGFDDNGLPTERLVERDLGCRADEMPRNDFVAKCMETTKYYEAEFKALWESLGFSCDWSLAYRTIDSSTWRISQREFLSLLKNGNAYTAEMPTLWCPHCGTSIAQAEVETKEEESQFHTLLFHLTDGSNTPLPIATTRPELLYGCVALFIHPENEKYAQYIGKSATVPIFDPVIPILANEDADPKKGTGIVMCATYGDAADAAWFKTYQLPYRAVLNKAGHLSDDVPHLAGLNIYKARKAVLALLQEANLLIDTVPTTHLIATHERCGTTVELLPSKQWYIRVLDKKLLYLDAADRIQWYPESMKERYLAWVSGLKWDWCVSRQRHFGIPIPVWTCADCGELILPTDEDLPVDPQAATPKQPCSKCGSGNTIPETSVLDTWATSSLTPQINARFGEANAREGFMPMSLRTQAHEIIRTWTFYTIVRSLYLTGEVPWKDIMLCGFVLAGKGEKISKSKNNAVLSPQALIQSRSADTVRYWAASAKLGTDTTFLPDELDQSDRMITKLWNAARFCAIHLKGFKPLDDASAKALPYSGTDLWIRAKIQETAKLAAGKLDKYESFEARKYIDSLFRHDFCDNWLELAKDRLYNPAVFGEKETLAARHTLYFVLQDILCLYAPFIPHITEAIYLDILQPIQPSTASPSLHLLPLPDDTAPNPQLLELGNVLDELLISARRYKTEHGMSMKDKLPELHIKVPAALESLLISCLPDIKSAAGADDPQVQFT